MKRSPLSRSQIAEAISSKLSMPRVQLSLMLSLTALFVFGFSVLLLRSGVNSMTLRYPIAILTGYIVFLFLLRVWIWLQSDEPVGDVDLPNNIIIPDISVPSGAVASFKFGGGGDFAGAGAGGSWSDADAPSPTPVLFAASSSGSSSGGGGSSSLGSFDLDDGAALVIVALVLLAVLGAFVYVIYIAPGLLAELIIDGAVVTTLYKPVKNIERHYWLATALKKTAIPAVIIAGLFSAAGFVMQAAEPTARTFGDFLRHVS